jgi:protein O-mannosyl-transferase
MGDQALDSFRSPSAGERSTRSQRASEAVILSPARWTRELPIVLALAALILVAYWGVWNFEFVYFDDPGYVAENLNVVRGLPLFKDAKTFCESVYWAFTAFEQSNWHPLTWLSHMLDVQLYGLNAGGHHVTNIIFHECNTLLLFWLLRLLTGQTWCSAAVAAMFAVHPMHVESVVWVSERKDVLSTFLGLLTLLVYVRYSRGANLDKDSLIVLGVLSAFTWQLTYLCFKCFQAGHPETFNFSLLWLYIPIFVAVTAYSVVTGRYNLLLYCAIFVLYAVGLLAKPMLVTLPCVCLLLDYWPLNRFAVVSADGPLQPVPVERPTVPRRRAKRNQRLPTRKEPILVDTGGRRSMINQALLLFLEKVPLLALSVACAIITPYAQGHGGSVASTTELPISFRIQNSLQSYAGYLGRMVWPGKMMSLHLLVSDEMGRPYVEPRMVVLSAVVISLLTAGAIVAFIYGRRYLTFGWFWYVGTLVPVIGFVQVGEQAMADRYTYIPYIGIFVAIVWAVRDLLENTSSLRRRLLLAVVLAMVVILGSWSSWSNYQIWTWRDKETHLLHALDVEPNNWNMLNNYGVHLWKEAQAQDAEAIKAEIAGDAQAAKKFHQKALALKADAKNQWNHGIRARSTATDIHSNLGYAYSEANDLDNAERHLTEAVKLKEISPRPHNNLGRVLLRRSQECDTKAAEAEAKAKTDPAEAEKAKQLRAEAKKKLNEAIHQFEEAVRHDPSLLEAHLNLGEVYLTVHEFDKSESHYGAILRLRSESVKDPETIRNFSQASFGLARVAMARNKTDDAIAFLQQALAMSPQNAPVMQVLALKRFERGEYRKAEESLWLLLAGLPRDPRRNVAEQFGKQFETSGKVKEAVQAWNFLAWAFATSPEPRLLDPEAAMVLAQRAVTMTKQQDPLSLDTLAAAQAASGQCNLAVPTAEAAIRLANTQGKKPLAEAIARRLQVYQQGKPYRCDPSGADRPY